MGKFSSASQHTLFHSVSLNMWPLAEDRCLKPEKFSPVPGISDHPWSSGLSESLRQQRAKNTYRISLESQPMVFCSSSWSSLLPHPVILSPALASLPSRYRSNTMGRMTFRKTFLKWVAASSSVQPHQFIQTRKLRTLEISLCAPTAHLKHLHMLLLFSEDSTLSCLKKNANSLTFYAIASSTIYYSIIPQ